MDLWVDPTAEDRARLIELLALYASIPDTNGWDELPPRVFTDSVVWDLESVNGIPPAEVSRSVLIDLLRPAFAKFEATHHAITNHRVRVDGDRALLRAHIRAEHWISRELVPDGPNCWLIVGFYDDEAVRTVDGWRLRSVRLTVTHRENDHLLVAAQESE
jgi:hypothetical protein